MDTLEKRINMLLRNVEPSVSSNVLPFLRFPGEIRNMVYEEYFSHPVLVEFQFPRGPFVPGWKRFRENPQDQIIIFKSYNRLSRKQMRRKLVTSDSKMTAITQWKNSASALHLVNRQVFEETIKYLFQTPRFSFSEIPVMKRFMQETPESSIRFITKLAVEIPTPATPISSNWFSMSIDSAVKAMPKVNDLALRIFVQQMPLLFTFREPWAQLLLRFKSWSIKRIDLDIQSPCRQLCKPSRLNHDRELKIVDTIHYFFEEAIMLRILGHSEWKSTESFRNWTARTTSVLNSVAQSTSTKPEVQRMIEQALNWKWVEQESVS